MRCGSLTSSDRAVHDDRSRHCVFSSTKSKESTVSSSMDKVAVIPPIKLKKMPNEVFGKHGELHRDQRHRHELRENLRHKQQKARVMSVRW